nr:hypothetical protein [Oscillospiraceae bacterium]
EKKFDDAEKYLKIALEFNPVSAQIIFELCEVYKITKRYSEFFEWTKEALQYSYSSKDIAHAYRNFGYYYIENQNFLFALEMYMYSELFDKNEMSASEIEYIKNKSNVKPIHSFEELHEVFEKEGIQIGVNEKIVVAIDNFADIAKENKDYRLALEAYYMLYDMTLIDIFKDKAKEITELLDLQDDDNNKDIDDNDNDNDDEYEDEE